MPEQPSPRITSGSLKREFQRLRGAVAEYPELRFLVERMPEDVPEPEAPAIVRTHSGHSHDAGPKNYDPHAAQAQKLQRRESCVITLQDYDQGTVLNPNRIPLERKREALEARQEIFQNRVRELNVALKQGRIDEDEWLRRMMGQVKDLHTTALAIGYSGRWDEIDQEDWGQVGAAIQKQYRFLRRWKRELQEEGVDEFSLAQLNDRAQKYGASASESYQIGYAAEVGVPIGELPAYPGDGTTECLTRCKCRWAINILDKERGDYDCTWMLGVAEHCETCLSRAAAWVQLEIRGGEMQSDFRAIFAR